MPLTSSLTVVAVGLGQVEEERVVGALALAERRLRRPCRSPCVAGSPCPWPGRPRRTGRSRCSPRAPPGSCTCAPSGPGALQAASTGTSAGAPARRRRGVDLGADRRVRADQRALVALDADRRVPHRDLGRDVALLPRAVPVGQVPSTGKALTGSRSPLPAIITAVTRWTKSGASSATIGGRPAGRRGRRRAPAPRGGGPGSGRPPRSCAGRPRRPSCRRSSRSRCLIWAIASSRGSTPESAKKQVCITVLMRPPMPGVAGRPSTRRWRRT